MWLGDQLDLGDGEWRKTDTHTEKLGWTCSMGSDGDAPAAARKLSVDLGGRLANLGRGITLRPQSSLRRKLWVDSFCTLSTSELGPIPLSHGAEVLGCLAWRCPCHQHTSTQGFICSPES